MNSHHWRLGGPTNLHQPQDTRVGAERALWLVLYAAQLTPMPLATLPVRRLLIATRQGFWVYYTISPDLCAKTCKIEFFSGPYQERHLGAPLSISTNRLSLILPLQCGDHKHWDGGYPEYDHKSRPLLL